jgi:ABC-type transport system substrate-binding protein
MRFTGSRLRAATSLILCAALAGGAARGARRPRYGGRLRVELHAATVTLDPRQWHAGTGEEAAGKKLATLIFDRLVTLDNYGRFQPQLAAEWTHDAAFHRWQFTLRSGVRFSNGVALTAADVAAALQSLLPAARQVSTTGNSVVIQSAVAMPDLLEELASGRYFIFRAAASGALAGTGPFVAAEPPAAEGSAAVHNESGGTHLFFRANADAWSGRPFVDAVDVTLGVPPLRQLYDLQLGRADLVELTPDLVRRAAQAGLRTWASAPVELYALRFGDANPAAQDASLREAVSLSLDRATMAGVLLQKQAEPAAALLPQWLSGYAFLFTVETNPDRAKELRASLPANVASGAQPLRLRVEAPGDIAKLLGDRVVVNARQSLLILQAVNRTEPHAGAGDPPGNAPAAGVRLVAWHCSSLSAHAELDAFVAAFGLTEAAPNPTADAGEAELYERERRILRDRRVLPLVVVPEFAGLGTNVHDWMPARWGAWTLADVWLDAAEAAPAAKPAGVQP